VRKDGTDLEVIDSGNIGSQSVNYATSSGNADTVDNLHASAFYLATNPSGYITGSAFATASIGGNAATATKLQTARNIAVTGAVTGNANFDGSGNISIATTATADPTLTLSGDASGSATFTNLGNATLSVTVNDDSHNHIISNVDGLQTALDGKAASSHTHSQYVEKNVGYEWTGTGGSALSFRSLDTIDTANGDQAALEIYQDTAGADAFMQFHIGGDYAKYFGLHGGINDFVVGGWSHGASYQRIYHDGYRPYADSAGSAVTTTGNAATATKLQTARNIALSGAVTGSANFDGSGNISIATTATADPTLTINGDGSGSATFTNLGNATLTLTVNDDSHNHIISNVDGLQAALDGKQAAGTYNTIIGTDTDLDTSGATIIDNIYVTDGVITSMGTRVLQASDINALQTASAPYYSPVEWSLLRYNTTYGWLTVSNPSDVVYELIKDGQTTISSGSTATTVPMTVSNLADDQILAMEIHSVGTGSTYTTNIVYVKLGSAANNSNNAVMFPSSALTTYGRITFLMVYRNATNSISTNYVYYNNSNATTYSADGIFIGRVWRLRGLVGD
jgi:hypothetical protein